ncbi:MAG: prenyltransferase [Candidatus Wenzhouxiangella sp. M2_3B_020]
MNMRIARGIWRLADPKISLTSVAGITVGATLAHHDVGIAWNWLGVTLLAYFCIEVAKNAWGEVFDYDSGVDQAVAREDRTSFSGGKRVLVENLLTRRQTWLMAAGFSAAGIALGCLIVFWREPLALWIGVAGFLLGWSYHGPPLQLAYRGLGELDVVICYGPLIVLSTYLIQTHQLSWLSFWLSLPLGFLIAAFLLVNEFPDYEADRRHGKRNLVARLGPDHARWLVPGVYGMGLVSIVLLPVTGLPGTVWLGALAALPAAWVSVLVLKQPRSFYRHTPAQPLALVSFLLYAACIAIAFAMV